MQNTYKILNIPQDAKNGQIAKAQIAALMSKRFSQTEITKALTILRKPATRLAADFTFPILKSEQMPPIETTFHCKEVDLSSLDADKYDSLK